MQEEVYKELRRCAVMSNELDRHMQELRYKIEGAHSSNQRDLSDITGSFSLPPMDDDIPE